MIIQWFELLGGLFFGLIPPLRLINCECRYLNFEGLWKRVMPSKIQNEPTRRRRWWKLPLVWVDPVRGYMTAYLIHDAFRVSPGATGMDKLWPVIATCVTLITVVVVQTSGRQSKKETLSPSGFLAGMMIALLPWIVSLSAIVLGVTAALAFNSFGAGYLAATGMTLIGGYFFIGRSLWLPIYTLLVMLPLLINWVRRSVLVVPVRG